MVIRSEIHTAMRPIIEKNMTSSTNRKYITYHNDAGGEPSHGYRQHAQNLAKIAHVVAEISSRTDGHTNTHTDILITILAHHLRGRSNIQYRLYYSSIIEIQMNS